MLVRSELKLTKYGAQEIVKEAKRQKLIKNIGRLLVVRG